MNAAICLGRWRMSSRRELRDCLLRVESQRRLRRWRCWENWLRRRERLIVLPGSGLHAGNIWEVVKKTRAREYHAGLSSVVPQPAENIETFEEEVWKMAGALADWE